MELTRVCMISSLHGPFDDRIYWKESLSLGKYGYEVIHLTVGRQNRDFITEEGVRVIEIRKSRLARDPYLDILLRKLTGRPGIMGSLLKACTSLDAHVYHFHDQQINRIGAKLKDLPQGPRVIYDVHEDYRDQVITNHSTGWLAPFAAWHASRIRRRELKRVGRYDAVVAAVPHIAGIFIKRIDPSRLHVIHNYTTMAPQSVPPLDERKWDAVYAGMINDSRCGLEMIEAAAMVRRNIPAFRMLLIGPVTHARYRQKLVRRIAFYRLQENVILKDAVPFSEMESILLQCKVGMGLFKPLGMFQYGIQVKTFEYMACGLPVVCSNKGTIYDIVSGNACGIGVDPFSAVETADALVRLLTDRDLWMKCSMNGMKAVREKYNWVDEEKKLVEIYREILSS